MTDILECGHAPTADAGIGTGYASDPDTGARMCYACADAAQREAIANGAATFGAYVRESDNTLTTWSGGQLARVTRITVGPWRYSAMGRWRMRYVSATTPDGRKWWGAGNDDYDGVTMRARKRA